MASQDDNQSGNTVEEQQRLQIIIKGDDDAGRVEIDTSAPFESVKEAASRFGGMGFWRPNNIINKPQNHQNESEAMDIVELEEQAAQLERDLVMKERETLDVLKELETTKMVVEELKANLQKEASEVSAVLDGGGEGTAPVKASAMDSCTDNIAESGLHACPSSAPGYILLELKQAKLNLTKTTDSLAVIRATVESYNKKIEKERISLEKTRQRLSSSASKISSLQTELDQTKGKLELINCTEGKVVSDNNIDLAKELQRLNSETEEFKKVGEAAKAEVSRAISEIEQAKFRIKTTEIRLVAAKKMKEAARATEAVALAEIKAMSNSQNLSSGLQHNPDILTIGIEEYSRLMSRAREAEAACESRLADATLQLEEANVSKAEILRKVEEATEEVKSSKKALEEALSRVENANSGKLAVEEALRKWRSERGQKRRHGAHNSTKFKNPYPSHLRKDSCRHEVNGVSLVEEELKPAVKTTISIGQILSRKLLLTEDFEKNNNTGKRKVSLAQMLGKHYAGVVGAGAPAPAGVGGGEMAENAKPAKRKKFGLARISLLVTKQNKKKKRQSAFSSGCMMSQ